MSQEERIVDLEVRLAYQEKLVAQLDDVIREFAKRVEALEWRVKELRESADGPDIGPADDPPPHY